MGGDPNKDIQTGGGNEQISAREAFEGKDVVLGREIIERLISEGVGLPVYKSNTDEKKTSVTYDRKPGEEGYLIREKHLLDKTLIGLIVNTGEENERIFIGIYEPGFVFKTNGNEKYFNSDRNSSFDIYSRSRFVEYFSYWIMTGAYDGKIILFEDKDSERFKETAVKSVEKGRKLMEDTKRKLSESRPDLHKRLFGEE